MALILLYSYAKNFHSIPAFWAQNPNSASVIELVNTVLPWVMCVSLKWFVNKYGFNSVYFIWWCACIKTLHLVQAQPDAYKWMLFMCFGLETIWPSQLDNLLVVTKVSVQFRIESSKQNCCHLMKSRTFPCFHVDYSTGFAVAMFLCEFCLLLYK